MTEFKKLFLLDGMALVYRAHFAFSKTPRFTSTGLNTSAVLGFANTLLEILNKEKPSHLAVVFDTPAPTERHIDFEAYKAHRQEMPEDLAIAIPIIKKLIEGFLIPVITLDGYEADDIIGTLAKAAELKGFKVFCMTPDKDFGQLVSEYIKIYKPAFMGKSAEILGVDEILEKWDIEHIEQVIDILGLWGDAADNIPGIPGIGEKTAKSLIKQFGSVEGVIAGAGLLKGKQKENIENFAAQGMLSKKLATILLNVPVELDEEALRIKAPDESVLKPLLVELEFKTLGRRIFGAENSATGGGLTAHKEPAIKAPTTGSVASGVFNQHSVQQDLFSQQEYAISFHPELDPDSALPPEISIEPDLLKRISDTPHAYHLIDTAAKREDLIWILGKNKWVSFDTETTSVDANQAELVGISFSVKAGEAYYIPLPENEAETKVILAEFKPILENPLISKTGQNIKYDIIVLKCYGIELSGELFDTMLAHYIIDPDTRHNMDYLSEAYLNYSPVSITELIGKKGKSQGNMRDVDIEKIKEYAAEDADVTLQLRNAFIPVLAKIGGSKLAAEIENPLIYVLAEMERQGVRVDKQILNDFSVELQKEVAILEKSICEKAGEVFNIASPKQLGEILFTKLNLDPKAKKTKTGQYQTGEDILAALAHKHDIVNDILDFRSLQKLKSTYVDALPEMINPKTGRIHTSYNQAIAATGRLSSTNPNLQNIPIRTERGREVRKAFIARDDDHILISADYSQIELRIIAEISKDPNMMDAFLNNIDIHTATAAKVYGVAIEEVDTTMRRNAKSVNFGIIYGQSAYGLSQNLGIARKEAAEIISQYFLQYPNIQKYMSDTISFAREHGYVETMMKRRRYLRDISSANQTMRGFAERNAINAPIQGSAADMIKIAMIRIHLEIKAKKLKTRMTMQVHDELVFDAPRNELEIMKPIIEHYMRNAITTEVPIVVEIGSGDNWLAAH